MYIVDIVYIYIYIVDIYIYIYIIIYLQIGIGQIVYNGIYYEASMDWFYRETYVEVLPVFFYQHISGYSCKPSMIRCVFFSKPLTRTCSCGQLPVLSQL